MMNRLIEATFRNRGYSSDYLYQIENPTRQPLKDVDLLCGYLKEIQTRVKYEIL